MSNEILIKILAIIYNIWHARNQLIFEEKDIPKEVVISRARNDILDLHKAHDSASTITQISMYNPVNRSRVNSRQNKNWRKLETRFIKANCDANLSEEGTSGKIR